MVVGQEPEVDLPPQHKEVLATQRGGVEAPRGRLRARSRALGLRLGPRERVHIQDVQGHGVKRLCRLVLGQLRIQGRSAVIGDGAIGPAYDEDFARGQEGGRVAKARRRHLPGSLHLRPLQRLALEHALVVVGRLLVVTPAEDEHARAALALWDGRGRVLVPRARRSPSCVLNVAPLHRGEVKAVEVVLALMQTLHIPGGLAAKGTGNGGLGCGPHPRAEVEGGVPRRHASEDEQLLLHSRTKCDRRVTIARGRHVPHGLGGAPDVGVQVENLHISQRAARTLAAVDVEAVVHHRRCVEVARRRQLA
mmetsp:Transcript_4174/g.11818  ORF Transcript_4174/g.11818 Transcript_4174/m.11818 type:complete len:307 (-) Transcript_4174:221-1141(-)